MELTINNESYYVPSAWHDLNQEEILDFCYAAYSTAPHQAQLGLLFKYVSVEMIQLLTAEQLSVVLKQAFSFIETNFTTPYIKYFEIQNTKYLLPQAEFANLNIAEFAYADNFYQQLFGIGNYEGNPNPAALNSLIATLCRPARHQVEIDDSDWNGDYRIKFNPHKVPTTFFTTELSEAQKLYFLKYYEGCKSALYNKYKVIFDKKKNEASSPKKFKETPSFGWAGIIFDLSESHVFGDKDKVAFQNLHDICYYLSKKQYEYDAQNI